VDPHEGTRSLRKKLEEQEYRREGLRQALEASMRLCNDLVRVLPRAGKKRTWSQTLNIYRNDVVHDAYLRFSKGKYDPHEILTIINHLHDVLARLILDFLRYDGGYLPKISRHTSGPLPVDWVKPDTRPSELGYEGMLT
jgi:hypothetical protein